MVPYTCKSSSKQAIQTKTIRFSYKIFVICFDDSYPYFIDLSNVHANLLYTQVKRWDSSQRIYIKINRPNCITEYNKHMGGVDSLDAHVSVYRIDVRGKKWYWPHYINTIDVLKSAAFKVFKLVNPYDKMDFLG